MSKNQWLDFYANFQEPAPRERIAAFQLFYNSRSHGKSRIRR
jgi:hypothetical protein